MRVKMKKNRGKVLRDKKKKHKREETICGFLLIFSHKGPSTMVMEIQNSYNFVEF